MPAAPGAGGAGLTPGVGVPRPGVASAPALGLAPAPCTKCGCGDEQPAAAKATTVVAATPPTRRLIRVIMWFGTRHADDPALKCMITREVGWGLAVKDESDLLE